MWDILKGIFKRLLKGFFNYVLRVITILSIFIVVMICAYVLFLMQAGIKNIVLPDMKINKNEIIPLTIGLAVSTTIALITVFDIISFLLRKVKVDEKVKNLISDMFENYYIFIGIFGNILIGVLGFNPNDVTQPTGTSAGLVIAYFIAAPAIELFLLKTYIRYGRDMNYVDDILNEIKIIRMSKPINKVLKAIYLVKTSTESKKVCKVFRQRFLELYSQSILDSLKSLNNFEKINIELNNVEMISLKENFNENPDDLSSVSSFFLKLDLIEDSLIKVKNDIKSEDNWFNKKNSP